MKNKVCKAMGVALAMAFIVASPVTSTTCHASGWGFNEDAHDDTDRGDMPQDMLDYLYGDSSDSGSNDSGSDTGSGASYNEVSSSNNESSGTADATSSGTAATGNAGKKNANSMTVSVTGGQKFRVVVNAVHTSCQVYHCGINKVTLTATDADGNAVAYNTVALEQGEDGLWYLNMTFAEGVDTTKLTVTADGDASYLSATLGVSGIKINGTVALSTVPATDTK